MLTDISPWQDARDVQYTAFLVTFMADTSGHCISADLMSRAFQMRLKSFKGTKRANIFYMLFEINRMRPSAIRNALSQYTGAKITLIRLDYETGFPDDEHGIDVYVNKKFREKDGLEYEIKRTVPFGLITDDSRKKSKNYFEWSQKDAARLENEEENARLHLECAVQDAVMNENPSDFVSSEVSQSLGNVKPSPAINSFTLTNHAKMVSKLRRSLDIAMTPQAIKPSGPKNQRGSRKMNSTNVASQGEQFSFVSEAIQEYDTFLQKTQRRFEQKN